MQQLLQLVNTADGGCPDTEMRKRVMDLLF